MPPLSGVEALYSGSVISPFTRLRRLLEGVAPSPLSPIELTIGEPREQLPGFIVDKIAEVAPEFAKYPPIRGSDHLRRAIADWLMRRYEIKGGIDPAREIHPINGSREGLFFAILPALGRKRVAGRPVVLLPNPYYQAYIGAALATNSEPVYLDATRESGFLPDLDRLEADPALLERAVAFYLCSPSNPQGAVASRGYLERALALARAHDFMLFVDECYSEIYSGESPPGGLEVAAATAGRYRNIVVFNSLSKRSNAPGLRSGLAAGDGDFLEAFAEIRNLTAPQMPGPVQHASAAIWSEEQHAASNRQAYRLKYDVADRVLAGRFGYRRPAGGFFLWLDVSALGGGVEAALTLWKRCSVKVVPGAYLAQPGRDGANPGDAYIRVALVQQPAVIEEALQRIVRASGECVPGDASRPSRA
jgi:aspartate/methionine/tyrosine aminotransferase